jgi:hypothetical protein
MHFVQVSVLRDIAYAERIRVLDLRYIIAPKYIPAQVTKGIISICILMKAPIQLNRATSGLYGRLLSAFRSIDTASEPSVSHHEEVLSEYGQFRWLYVDRVLKKRRLAVINSIDYMYAVY